MEMREQDGGFRLAADGPVVRHDWGLTRVVCDPDTAGARKLTVLEATFEPGGGHPFHQHPEQEEVLYVVAGRVEQWVGRERLLLGPGDSAFVPAGVVHASYTVGDAPSRLVAIFGPSVGAAGFTTIEMAGEEPWRSLRG